MRKKRALLLLALLLMVLGLFLWHTLQPKEVTYQGRPLSAWLKDMEGWSGDTNDPAFVAFREMGTNAIPALLGIIKSGGPPLQRTILEINRKQSLVNLPFGTPWYQTMAATRALYAMGPKAKPALPVLKDLLFHTNALVISGIALAGIGSDAVPVLLAALTNQCYRIRDSAALGLGLEQEDFDVVVPALIGSLSDNNRIVHDNAVIALGEIHAKPELAVPALMKDFPSNDAVHRSLVLISLRQFGAKGRASLPVVTAALKDPNQDVRIAASATLKQIDTAFPSEAGSK